MNVIDAYDVILKIKELKTALIKVQDYENATLLRDMEKKYLDGKVDLPNKPRNEDFMK